MHKLNILVIGGMGFIGSTLSGALLAEGHAISVLSRSPASGWFLGENVPIIRADVSKTGLWQDQISDYDVIVNLTGASIFRRWTGPGKREIVNSRILTAGNIVEAIRKKRGNIQSFISVSGVGFYGFHGESLRRRGKQEDDRVNQKTFF